MKIKIVCAHCKSENVFRDAYAVWDVDTQAWVGGPVYDVAVCDDCGRETELEEVELKGDENGI